MSKISKHVEKFLQGLNFGSGVLDLCGEEIIFEGDSPYHHITIKDEPNGLRTMYFGPCADEAETSINLHRPDDSVFEYPGMMLLSLALNPKGRRVLLMGLGGGYIPSVFQKHLPDYNLTVVEIDPLVCELADTYFGFSPGGCVNLVIEDGLEYLTQYNGPLYDFIWLDAFSGNYVPPHMSGCDFLSLCRSKLTSKGVLAQNLHQNNPLVFGLQLQDTETVFEGGCLGLDGVRCGNAIIMSSNDDEEQFGHWTARSLIAAVKKFDRVIGSHKLDQEAKKYKLFDCSCLLR